MTTRVTLTGNAATGGNGGALFLSNTPSVVNVTGVPAGNKAPRGAGGVVYWAGVRPLLPAALLASPAVRRANAALYGMLHRKCFSRLTACSCPAQLLAASCKSASSDFVVAPRAEVLWCVQAISRPHLHRPWSSWTQQRSASPAESPRTKASRRPLCSSCETPTSKRCAHPFVLFFKRILTRAACILSVYPFDSTSGLHARARWLHTGRDGFSVDVLRDRHLRFIAAGLGRSRPLHLRRPGSG